MSFAIVYHVYKNSTTLIDSLESLLNQSDNNFDLILVNDGATSSVTNKLKDINLSKFKKLIYYKWNQNVGHASSFNEVIKDCQTTHIHYSGSNFIFDKDFVKNTNAIINSNKPDVISFISNKNDLSKQTFSKLNSKMSYLLYPSMKDKIFSVNLLRENNIFLIQDFYAPLVFLYQVLMKFEKWIVIDAPHITYHKNKYYTYNLYDIFEQNNYLINKYKKTPFWTSSTELMNFFMIIYLLNIFLPRMYRTYTDSNIRKNATSKVENWLKNNIPEWRKNKILNSKKNYNPTLFNKFYKIKLNVFYLKKFYRKNLP